MIWLVSPGKAPVELRAALQVKSLLSSQSLKREEVVQGGIGMKITVGDQSLSFYGCGLKREIEDCNPLHIHSPAASKEYGCANPSLDTLWPCGSYCSPFALGPQKDFCMLFSKHLFCNSDLSKCGILCLSRSSGPYQIFILGISLDKHRCRRVVQAKHLFFPRRCFPCKLIKVIEVWKHRVVPINRCHDSRFIFWLIQSPNPSVYKMKTYLRTVKSPNN